MTARWWRTGWLGLAVWALRPAAAETPILHLSDVQPGMKGYGLTVYQGTNVEKFDVTVLGVLRGFDFAMDMILIRVENGPCVTKQWGILAGMSGSPIYVDGKLMGALAYGWEFQKEAVAGITPIEQMLAQYDPKDPRVQTAALHGSLRPDGGEVRVAEQVVHEVRVLPTHAAARQLTRVPGDVGILTPVATPLFVGGLGLGGMQWLSNFLAPYNIVPLQAGAAAVPADTPAALVPGAAVAVTIGSGDIDLTAIGTVTYVEGDTVLAFGHPFFGFGAVDMPMATASITSIISAANESFKMGGPIKAVGRIAQDRPTCIGGKIGPSADTLPVQYHLQEKARGTDRSFHIDLIRQPSLSEMFTAMMMQKASQNVAGQSFDGVTTTHLEIEALTKGSDKPVRIVRHNAFDSRASAGVGVNPLYDLFMTLSQLRRNPFGEARVLSVKVDLEFEGERRFANIDRVQAGQFTARRGDTVNVTLYLKPYGGETRPLTIPVKVPDNAPLGRTVVVIVGGSDGFTLRPRINPGPSPRDVPSLVQYLNNTVPNDCVLVEMLLPSSGVEIGGRQIRDIPEPVAEALFTSSANGLRMIRDVAERIIPTDEVIAGVGAVMVEVVGDEGKKQEGGQSFEGIDMPGGGLGGPMGGSMMEEATAIRQEALRLFSGGTSADLAWLAAPGSAARDPLAAALAALPRPVQAAPRAHKPRPRADAPADAEAKPEPGPDPAAEGDKQPPDVTSQLELDKPPKMPGWSELDELEKGKLLTESDTATEEGGGKEGGAEEDKPLGRPVTTWVVSKPEDVLAGKFDGTFPGADGRIALAPVIKVLDKPDVERAWSVLVRPDGSVVVGTWAEHAGLIEVKPDGHETWLCKTDDVGMPAAATLSDGTLVAGGIPSGRIYRIADGKAVTWVELGEPYIWALSPDAQGGVYAATGNNGRLYHVAADGTAKVVLQSSDRHLYAMCAIADGVVVGTYPLGKVYRVRGEQVETIFQGEDAPVLSLAATPNGSVYVGAAGNGKVYRVDTAGEVHELGEGDSGSVHALASLGDTVYAAFDKPGRILRFDDGDGSAQIYRTDEPFLLGLAGAGQSLVTTVAGSGEVISLGLASGRRGTYTSSVHDAGARARWGRLRFDADTNNGAYLVVDTRSGNTSWPDNGWSAWSQQIVAADGEPITSPPARYIQFRATLIGDGGDLCRLNRVELFYRTINRAPTVEIESPEPGEAVHKEVDVKWSAEDPDEDELTYEVYYAPAGTDQWTRIEEKSEAPEGDDGAAGDEGDEMTAPEGDDEPAADAEPAEPPVAEKPAHAPKDEKAKHHQKPPKPGAKAADEPADKPGDLQRDPPGQKPKEKPGGKPGAAKPDGAKPDDGKPEKPTADEEEPKPLTEEQITWDTTKVPDGLYVVKVVARDEVRNPEDPRSVEKVSRPFRVDNTAPYAMADPAADEAPLPADVTLVDEGTWLASGEYRFDDGKWTAVVPADGIFDSLRETVKLPQPPEEEGAHVLHLRVRDGVGNVLTLEYKFKVGG